MLGLAVGVVVACARAPSIETPKVASNRTDDSRAMLACLLVLLDMLLLSSEVTHAPRVLPLSSIVRD